MWNVLVDWEVGPQTWDPVNIMAKQDPMTIVKYAHDHELLKTPGWKFL